METDLFRFPFLPGFGKMVFVFTSFRGFESALQYYHFVYAYAALILLPMTLGVGKYYQFPNLTNGFFFFKKKIVILLISIYLVYELN